LPVFVDPYAVSAASPVEVRVVRNRSHMEKPNTINSALLALSIVGIAATEIGMLRALTPESYMAAIRWFQVPIWSGYVAVVGLVYLRLRPRRLWLGWLALGLRSVALVATFASAPSLNYATLTAVEHITLLGETVAIPVGVPNPWMLTGQASLVVLALFVIDGGLKRLATRRGRAGAGVAIGAHAAPGGRYRARGDGVLGPRSDAHPDYAAVHGSRPRHGLRAEPWDAAGHPRRACPA
jgi:hypothetical protein